MKNVSKHTMFAMVAVVALSLFSCTKDDGDKAPDTSGQTASAKVNFKVEEPVTANLTGRDVERGTLHAWIKSIHIEGGAAELTHPRTFDFDLVDDGTPGAAHDFVLDQLAIGRNNFNVTTTTSTVGIFRTEQTTGDVDNIMAKLKGQSPWAVYSAPLILDISLDPLHNNGGAPVLLKTQNGRHIAVFKMAEDLTSLEVWAKVTPIVNGVAKPALDVNIRTNALAYWSDATCVAGQTIQYQVRLFRGDGNPLMDNGVQIGFTSLVSPIVASTSTNRIYTITRTAISQQASVQTFTAEEWKDDNGNEDTNNWN